MLAYIYQIITKINSKKRPIDKIIKIVTSRGSNKIFLYVYVNTCYLHYNNNIIYDKYIYIEKIIIIRLITIIIRSLTRSVVVRRSSSSSGSYNK